MAGPGRGARELGLQRESGLAYVSRQIEYMFGELREGTHFKREESRMSVP